MTSFIYDNFSCNFAMLFSNNRLGYDCVLYCQKKSTQLLKPRFSSSYLGSHIMFEYIAFKNNEIVFMLYWLIIKLINFVKFHELIVDERIYYNFLNSSQSVASIGSMSTEHINIKYVFILLFIYRLSNTYGPFDQQTTYKQCCNRLTSEHSIQNTETPAAWTLFKQNTHWRREKLLRDAKCSNYYYCYCYRIVKETWKTFMLNVEKTWICMYL